MQYQSAIATDAVASRILSKGLYPEDGAIVGCRLNLNILKRTGVSVHSVHDGGVGDGYQQGRGLYRKEVITYLPWVRLKNAYFNVDHPMREQIARGLNTKTPMASVDGEFVHCPDLPKCTGKVIRFNPHQTHFFIDEDDFAVEYAQDVMIVGHRVFASGEVRYVQRPRWRAAGRAFRSIARLR